VATRVQGWPGRLSEAARSSLATEFHAFRCSVRAFAPALARASNGLLMSFVAERSSPESRETPWTSG